MTRDEIDWESCKRLKFRGLSDFWCRNNTTGEDRKVTCYGYTDTDRYNSALENISPDETFLQSYIIEVYYVQDQTIHELQTCGYTYKEAEARLLATLDNLNVTKFTEVVIGDYWIA